MYRNPILSANHCTIAALLDLLEELEIRLKSSELFVDRETRINMLASAYSHSKQIKRLVRGMLKEEREHV